MTTENKEYTAYMKEKEELRINVQLRLKAFEQISKLRLKTFSNISEVFEEQLEHKLLGSVYTELMSEESKDIMELIRKHVVDLRDSIRKDIENADISLKKDLLN